MVMLACKLPKLRQHAAESLHTMLVTISCRPGRSGHSGVWAKPSAWTAHGRLLATCWDSSDMKQIKEARQELISALGLEAPVPKATRTGSSAPSRRTDALSTYGDLLANASRDM
jgi:hypothetical protein